MPIKVTCPACGQRSQAPDDARGKLARCPTCEQAFLIPAPAPGPTAEGSPHGGEADEPPTEP